MRWDDLFDDLESQLEHELGAEDLDLAAEEERLRLGRTSLRSRLQSLVSASPAGSEWSVLAHLTSGRSIPLRPTTFGKDWLSAVIVADWPQQAECVLPLASIAGLSLDAEQLERSLVGDDLRAPPDRLSDRIGLSFVLRDLCRRRRSVGLECRTGLLQGTIDRVGRDHLDLAVHEAGSERRRREVTDLRVVGFDDLVLVRL